MNCMKVLAIASLVVLSACGGGDGPTGPEPATVTTTTTTTPASAQSNLRKALSSVRIQAATPEQAAEQLMNFAQSSAYASFFPGNPSTQSYPPFKYRAYSNGVVLGVVVNDSRDYTKNGVYVMGGPFGASPSYVGQLTDFITPTDPDPLLLAFTPSSLVATGVAGESRPLKVTARWNKTISEPINIAVVDRAGVISPDVTIDKGYDASGKLIAYIATLRTSASLAVGTHAGNFEVRLCRDNAATCSSPYPGSPWQVPYAITIEADTNLKPLRPLAGASDWTTAQGNAAHTGHVAAAVEPANFSRRFAWVGQAGNVATAECRVFSVVYSPDTDLHSLQALSEADGKVLWKTRLSNVTFSPPAVLGGRVYVASAYHTEVIDSRTGARLARVTRETGDGDTSLAPTPHGDKLYMKSHGPGGISRFDGTAHRFDWFSRFDGYLKSTPAVDDTHAYACGNEHLYVLNPNVGAIVAKIASPRSMGGSVCMPVLDGAGAVYVTKTDSGYLGTLMRFDVNQRARTWDVDQQFRSPAVLANGALYVTNGKNLEARSPSTGALQWSWTAPGSSSTTSHLLVVGRIAFLGTTVATHAIDLDTRQSVWSYPATGPLAVSANGVLYISTAGTLVAINLH